MNQDHELIEKFWSKVNKTNDCWIWTGAQNYNNGYGSFWFKNQHFLAHRFSYLLANNSIPDGFQIHHKCENTSCVNPEHLEAVTQQENIELINQSNRQSKRHVWNEILEYEDDSTNYMTPQLFQEFKWGLYHLEPFTSENGRPPMEAFDYVMMFEVQFACGLRITEALNLIKEDFDLKHRILKLWNPKTKKGGYQKTTIPPYLIPTLEKYLKRFPNSDQMWSINRQNAWRYAKDAGRLAGLSIFEEHENHDIEGVWTHMFRKACSKRMQELGASRELRMLKLRHAFKDAHDAYDKVDIMALLKWEAQHLDVSQRSLT